MNIDINKPKKNPKKVRDPLVLPLNINPKPHQSGMGVDVNVQLDGETVDTFRSESFYPMFYQILEAMMHGGRRTREIMWSSYYSSNHSISDVFSSGTTIGVQLAYEFWYSKEEFDTKFVGAKLGISGVKGIPLNGTYKVRQVLDTGYSSPERFELENLDGSDITVDPTPWTAGTGKVEAFTIRLDNTFIRRSDSDDYRSIENTQVWDLIIGRGTGNEDFEQIWLEDRILDSGAEGELQHTEVSFTAQTTNKPSSSFTLIRSFQNPAANTQSVDISEYGIISYINDRTESDLKSLLSRDVRASVSVPPDSQLSVQLTAKVVLEPDTQDTETDGTNGGFLDGFINLFRTLATQSNSDNSRNNYFQMANAPGGGHVWEDYQQLNHELLGMRLGTDNTFVSMTDDSTLGLIPHGDAAGELYYWGTDVGNLQVEADKVTPANNKAYFDITRMFENRTANPITVAEVGLNGNSSNGGLNSGTAIARFALETADQITIQPGEIQPIVMRIGKG